MEYIYIINDLFLCDQLPSLGCFVFQSSYHDYYWLVFNIFKIGHIFENFNKVALLIMKFIFSLLSFLKK